MGLVIFGAMALYFLIAIAVVIGAVAYARKRGRSAARWGVGAALVMYLLVFWDHIPTVVAHKYYCEKEAGFWVYKTPEQWMKENPKVAETLTWQEISSRTVLPDGTQRTTLNERLVRDMSFHKIPLLSTFMQEEKIIDLRSGEVLAKRISVGSGYGNLGVGGKDWHILKFWLSLDPCVPETNRFSAYFNSLHRLGTKK